MIGLSDPAGHRLKVWMPVDNESAPQYWPDWKVFGVLEGVCVDINSASDVEPEYSVIVIGVPCDTCVTVCMTLYHGLSTIDSLVKGRVFS